GPLLPAQRARGEGSAAPRSAGGRGPHRRRHRGRAGPDARPPAAALARGAGGARGERVAGQRAAARERGAAWLGDGARRGGGGDRAAAPVPGEGRRRRWLDGPSDVRGGDASIPGEVRARGAGAERVERERDGAANWIGSVAPERSNQGTRALAGGTQ